MKVTKSEFIKSSVADGDLPTTGLLEVALVGRSNVGKSSLINRLINRKNLARTSNTPGKTRLLNYYLINDSFYFVDLPGYGYAQVSKQEQAKWGRMMEQYLATRETLVGVLQLVDLRHPPTDLDRQMMDYLTAQAIPYAVVATKADKLSNNQRSSNLSRLVKQIARERAVPVMAFSADNGYGKDGVWEIVEYMLQEK